MREPWRQDERQVDGCVEIGQLLLEPLTGMLDLFREGVGGAGVGCLLLALGLIVEQVIRWVPLELRRCRREVAVL